MEPAVPPPGAGRPPSENKHRKHHRSGEGRQRGPAPLAPVSQTGTTKRYMVHGAPFDVPLKYDLIDVLGVGSYGVVCRAVNTCTKERVAIKKMANVFADLTDCKRILRELKLLVFLSHPNVISIKDAFWINRKSCDTIGIVTELMDTDLQRMIKEGGGALGDQHHRFFVYQVLRALKYIHSAGIIHRDLKPGNLLINSNCDLRVCDFGLARGMEGARLTEYVVTRWFRPPELLLMTSEYGPAVDMWSVGCILAELIGGRPLFPGRDYIHQLELITDVVGVPPREEMTSLPEEAILHLESIAPKATRRLADILPMACPDAIDLLEKLLVFTPERRLTAAQALAHPYFASLHDPQEEPVADKEWLWEHESRDLTQEELRALFWQELTQWQAEDSMYDINQFLA